MAQRGDKSSQVPGIVSGRPGGGRSGGKPGPARSGSGSGKPRSGSRQSVAAARRSKGDKTQLIIGGVAVVVIIAIIAIGLVLYKKSTATQGSGYGVSKSSTASVDDKGIITVSNGSPALQLDIYEDALCPICGEFEAQFGQQIAKAIDAGQLTVHYHMVDFLNPSSVSKTYSTRAYGALLAVAKNDGGQPGLFMQFHSALFSPANQPKEVGSGGTSDLSNAQLASLAGSVKASEQTQQQISGGAEVTAAGTDATANMTTLTAVAAKVGTQPGTPTVVHNGTPVQTNNVNWLTNLLPKSSETTATSGTGG